MTMLAIHLVLLILPAIVYSKININIKPGKTRGESAIEISGQDDAILTWDERKSFGFYDHVLKDAYTKFKGRRCDALYINDPTEWGNVYARYGWSETKRHITPFESKIIRLDTKPIAVSTAVYVNNHDTIPSVYITKSSYSVEETVVHTWFKRGEFTINLGISYKIFGLDGTAAFSHNSRWGEDTTKSKSVTIGTSSAIATTVPPGAKVFAKIIATQGTMEIEIKYKVTFSGCLFCHYKGRYQGHYFYCYDIHQLLEAANLPQEHIYTEKLNVGFYSDARLEVSNANLTNETHQ